MAAIELDDVSKVYPNGVAAVRTIDLSIADGELMILVGPSGCGKSTVLRVIAGLEAPNQGHVIIGGRDVTMVPPQSRNLAMVFQNYALYPHMTVRQNLAFGLLMRKTPSSAIVDRVQRVAATLGIETLLDRKPAELSGGQRQRVAVGRAVVRDAAAFLLDEPLSNLDPRLRADMRAELAILHRRIAATMVYVTHDQEEAMTLGDRLAVMRNGVVEQLGTPLDVYRRPANSFVAGFVGSPAMNLMPCACERINDALRITFGGASLYLKSTSSDQRAVLLGVRPQDIDLVSFEADTGGRVEVIERLGASTLVHVRVDTHLVRVLGPADLAANVDEAVGLRVRRDRLHVFDPDSGRRLDEA
jgi:ABC-type sugar transport system ATPase subunit